MVTTDSIVTNMSGEKKHIRLKGPVDYDFPFQFFLPISILHQIHLDKEYPFLTGRFYLCLNLTNLKIDV